MGGDDSSILPRRLADNSQQMVKGEPESAGGDWSHTPVSMAPTGLRGPIAALCAPGPLSPDASRVTGCTLVPAWQSGSCAQLMHCAHSCRRWRRLIL
jgi:hypothetical protein